MTSEQQKKRIQFQRPLHSDCLDIAYTYVIWGADYEYHS